MFFINVSDFFLFQRGPLSTLVRRHASQVIFYITHDTLEKITWKNNRIFVEVAYFDELLYLSKLGILRTLNDKYIEEWYL